MLYFDPVTKQVWTQDTGGGDDVHMDEEDRLRERTSGGNTPTPSNPPVEDDSSDDEINAAARLLDTVSPTVSYRAPGVPQINFGPRPTVLGHLEIRQLLPEPNS